VDRPEQLVAQVAVAVLHVDEVEPGLLGEDGSGDEGVDQVVELVVGQHRSVVALDADATVEDRMVERGARRGSLRVASTGPSG
jgi:hypothetical protein